MGGRPQRPTTGKSRFCFFLVLLTLAALVAPAQQPSNSDKLQHGPQSSVDAHISKGTQLLHDQLYEAAAKEFEQAAALQPNNAEALFEDAARYFRALGQQ